MNLLSVVVTAGMLICTSVSAMEGAWQKHMEREEEKAKNEEVRRLLVTNSVKVLKNAIPLRVDEVTTMVGAEAKGTEVELTYRIEAMDYGSFQRPAYDPEKSVISSLKQEVSKGVEKSYCADSTLSNYAISGIPVTFIMLYTDGVELLRRRMEGEECFGILDSIERELNSDGRGQLPPGRVGT